MNVRVFLLISVICASCGQLLFKKGMSSFGNLQLNTGITQIALKLVQVIFSPYVFSGMILYIASTVFWLIALSKADLSYAYPFTLLTFLLVLVGSYVVFHESFHLNRLVGAIIIAIGVIVVSLK